MSGSDSIRRRRLLELSGVAVGVALAGCSDGGGDGGDGGDGGNGDLGGDESPTGTGTDGGTQQIKLGAQTSGWVGQEPQEIADQTNPTLPLEAGTTYEITWENLDGEEHELIIQDSNEQEVEASDSAQEQEKTVTLEFEATEEMAGYICEYHPNQMSGDVETSAGAGTGGSDTNATNDTGMNETDDSGMNETDDSGTNATGTNESTDTDSGAETV